MTIALAVLSQLPILIGFVVTGDFPQLFVKPPRSLVFAMFRDRSVVLALCLSLWAFLDTWRLQYKSLFFGA